MIWEVIIVTVLLLLAVILSLNVYHYYTVRNDGLYNTVMLVVNSIFAVIVLILLIITSVSLLNVKTKKNITPDNNIKTDTKLKTVNTNGCFSSIIPFTNKEFLTIIGREGKEVKVKRIQNGLYQNIEDPLDFYKCKNNECDSKPPDTKFIFKNYEEFNGLLKK